MEIITKNSRALLKRRIGRLSVRGWLEILALVTGVACIAAILFIRRDLIEYHPSHTFSVRDPEFFGSAHASADPIPVKGNRITLLHNGNGIFPELLSAIQGAQKTINFEAFIFHSGEVGNQFIQAFIDKAKAGVEVRIIVDGVGSGWSLNNSDVDRLKQAGCQFYYYHPARSIRLDRINRRTHRRLLIVDGNIGFTGGVGFGDDWRGDGNKTHEWREVHVKVEGPLVAKLQSTFQQHWLGVTDEILVGPHHYPMLKPAGNLKAQVVASTEFSVAPLPLVQAVSIAAAEKTIYITNPYCTPTDDQIQLLNEAVKRGVDVRLLLPGVKNDQPATKAAGRTAYGKLLQGGVKIFEFKPTMIHSKTMVVDGMFSILGTSNLDSRSSQINEEVDLTVYDESFGKEMEQVFLKDLEQAGPYTYDDFKKRSLWDRFTEWLTWPLSSQL
ncbi:cardiolipin synthase B [Phragmitibacter flavus]|uniref:Cardiolipin synthase B n=1 Tax=Phragmitibacter flavus TaxID=2576071 RepID=A0A5R8KA29_9BACT|nr:phospholipase D-like domain-containing protein [Phragmitibacter flavus]TLD68389.1 cardiolipin synthase B [Phragmitibacter flavus]